MNGQNYKQQANTLLIMVIFFLVLELSLYFAG
jgi:hypothetical protein